MPENFQITEENLYLHGLNLFPQFGPTRLYKLCQFFKNSQAAFSASAGQMIEAGIEPEIAESFALFKQSINLRQQAQELKKENIGLLNFREESYPKLLLEISKFPILLYYKGRLGPADELCVSVVGTRKISAYGHSIIPTLIEPLIDAGVTIVSGLAFGVDSTVQKMAVNKKRRTIAVLGGGLDEKTFYPKEHTLLAQEILETGGALLSEYPMLTPPLKHHFIARNRIISGLSVATLIVECNLKSGSLITARYALEQNRTVYAVPGPIYAENSKGPNNLIKMGAKLVTEANDILEDLNLKTLPEQQTAQILFGDTPIETKLLQILNHEPLHINLLIKQLEFDASEVTSALTFLEMKGKVRNLGGQQYVLSR